MKKVLILVQSHVSRDNRVKRQIEWLKGKYEIFLSAIDAPIDFPKENFYPLPFFKNVRGGRFSILLQALLANSGFFSKYHFIHFFHNNTLRQLKGLELDLIIANDANALPLAYQLKQNKPGIKLIYDDHEYAPTEYEGNRTWEFLYKPINLILLKRISLVDQVVTVGYFIADRFRRDYQVDPLVITNAPPKYIIQSENRNSDKIRLIHHGITSRERQPELMIEMASHLDNRFELYFMLMGESKYLEELQELAKPVGDKIKFMKPVGSNEIVKFISQFDIGVYILPPLNFTFLNALPNKLFEFIQAGLAIAIAPSKEMAKIVREYEIGVVSTDFSPKSLANEINKITNEMLIKFKKNTGKAADELNAENNGILFLKMVDNLVS